MQYVSQDVAVIEEDIVGNHCVAKFSVALECRKAELWMFELVYKSGAVRW